MESAAHRPKLAGRALKHRVVYCKRQARLAVAARDAKGAGAESVIEVRRMHLRAQLRRACPQTSQRIARTAPGVC